jgi:hypothetical protein
MHEDTGIAITGHHASRASVPAVVEAVQVEYRTERLSPCLAAPDVQVPIQIEVFVASDTRKDFRIAVEMVVHVVNRCSGIYHGEMTLERLDSF